MRINFDIQLDLLNKSLIEMGALCEVAIANSAKALLTGDRKHAEKAIEADSEIDRKEKEIEDLCIKLLLQQQPVAKDLRQISSALKMITDMERIGDQAADISDIVLASGINVSLVKCQDIEAMAKATIKMVTDSIDAFVKRDLDAARAVIESDDIVDNLFVKVKEELIEAIMNDRSVGGVVIDVLMIAKYLERIGDHATNIAEWVVYSVTGVHKGIAL